MAKVRELCSMIYGRFDTESEFAKYLGWDRRRLNKITTGNKEPSLQETAEIAAGLGISLEDVAAIFLHK